MKLKLIALLIFFTMGSSVDLLAQEVTIFPGFFGFKYYQDENRINKKEMESLLMKDAEAHKYWKKSKTFNSLALTFLAVEVGFLVWELDEISNGGSGTGQLIGVLASGATGIVFAVISGKQKEKAVLRYNAGLEKRTTFKLKPSKQGVGFVLQF